eukprot:scaffold172464_cov21-Tisochrysis_lutea.AAC.1
MSAADSWGALAICFLSKGNFSYFPIPGITACLQYGWGHCSHHLTSHFALGISLAKSGNQVGFWSFKWTLPAVFQTAIILRSQ